MTGHRMVRTIGVALIAAGLLAMVGAGGTLLYHLQGPCGLV